MEACASCQVPSSLKCLRCMKPVCERCRKLKHCKCSIVQGNLLFDLRKTCPCCAKAHLDAYVIALWDMHRKIRLDEASSRLRNHLDTAFEVTGFSRDSREDCVFGDFFEQVPMYLEKHDFHFVNIFLVTDRPFTYLVNKLLYTVIQRESKLFVMKPDSNELNVVIPRPIVVKPLLDFLEKSANEGKIFTFEKFLCKKVNHAEDMISQALALGKINEWHMRGGRGRIINLTKLTFNEDVLRWTITSLEINRLFPFISRIQNILINLFNLNVSDREVFSVFEQCPNAQKFEPLNSCNEHEMALSFKEANHYKQETFEQIRQGNAYQALTNILEYDPCDGMHCTIMKSIYYKTFHEIFRERIRISEIFRALEAKARSNSFINNEVSNLEEIEKLVKLILEGNDTMSIKQLEIDVEKRVYPKIINLRRHGYLSFVQFLSAVPQFRIRDNVIELERDYQPDLDNECIICFEVFDNDKYILQCKHFYHRKCIKEYLDKQENENNELDCPKCHSAVSRDELFSLNNGNYKSSIQVNIPRRKIENIQEISKIVVEEEKKEARLETCPRCKQEIINNICSCTRVTSRIIIACNVCGFDVIVRANEAYGSCKTCFSRICKSCRYANCQHLISN